MYNEKTELDEELKRLMKDVKDRMEEQMMQAVEQDHVAWLNEQVMTIKATGKTQTNSDAVARQAYVDAAKKTLDTKLNALITIAQTLSDMEEKRDAIKKGSATNVPVSAYLDMIIPKIRDSLEFGVPQKEKEAIIKRYGDEFLGMQYEAVDKIMSSCDEMSANQDLHAKEMRKAGIGNEGVLKGVARDAYLTGVYTFIGEVTVSKAAASKLLAEMDEKKNAIRSGTASDYPVLAYLEEKIPKLKECLVMGTARKECRQLQKVS